MVFSPTEALAREKIRPANQLAILNAIHKHGRVSRSDLAAELRLSPATVTLLTGALIASGLVYEARAGTSKTVGRKPILLALRYGSAHVVGVKVSSAGVTSVLTDLKSDVLALRESPLAAHDVETVMSTVHDAVRHLVAEGRVKLVGVGVNLPGVIDDLRGTVRFSPLLGWQNVPFGHLLEARLELPTLVENDVNALATAEAWFGSGKQHDDFLVVTLGRGVGLGIVIGGAVYRGKRGSAGEFGHTILNPEGPLSPQTQRGSVEAYLSDDALLEQARARIPDFPKRGTPEALVARAQAGQPEALRLYAEAGRILGIALSNLVNLFAPDLLILSGEGMRAAEYLLPAAREALGSHTFGDLAEGLELVVDPWGDDAWARGAASLAARRYLFTVASQLGGD